LNEAALAKVLPDGRPPLDMPPQWKAQVEKAPVFGRAGSCEPGALLLTEVNTGRRWRVAFARVTCAVTLTSLDIQAT